jgi:hypothetical protein
VAAQVSNPIAAFSHDNNGAVLRFPTTAAGGTSNLSGLLVFGIGTADNNQLGSATVLTVDELGNFTTIYKSVNMGASFLDSGTNSFSFNDTSIPVCTSVALGFFCPPSTLNLSAINIGRNNMLSMVSFSVSNADGLFANTDDTAFSDLAGPGIDDTSFDWGFPFFIGRAIFVAIDGASTPGGKGPYFAY